MHYCITNTVISDLWWYLIKIRFSGAIFASVRIAADGPCHLSVRRADHEAYSLSDSVMHLCVDTQQPIHIMQYRCPSSNRWTHVLVLPSSFHHFLREKPLVAAIRWSSVVSYYANWWAVVHLPRGKLGVWYYRNTSFWLILGCLCKRCGTLEGIKCMHHLSSNCDLLWLLSDCLNQGRGQGSMTGSGLWKWMHGANCDLDCGLTDPCTSS